MSTLSEVAKTGRKFRRKSDPAQWFYLEGKVVRYVAASYQTLALDAEMIVATDWEAEPLKLELTATDILRAARVHDDIASKRRLSAAEFGKLICQELGLMEESA